MGMAFLPPPKIIYRTYSIVSRLIMPVQVNIGRLNTLIIPTLRPWKGGLELDGVCVVSDTLAPGEYEYHLTVQQGKFFISLLLIIIPF